MRFYIREKCQNVSYNPEVVWNEFKDLGKADQESQWVVYLNQQNKLIKKEMLALGNSNALEFDPIVLFKHALLNDAHKIIIVHNHPTGNSEPSEPDIETHERIKKGGELLGIKLLDDIIIGDNECYSHITNKIYSPKKKRKKK